MDSLSHVPSHVSSVGSNMVHEDYQRSHESSVGSNMVHEDYHRRLVEDMKFPSELAIATERSGVAHHLLRLKDSGFEISDEQPLFFVVLDINNRHSVDYLNSGNFGLSPEIPGARQWPEGIVPSTDYITDNGVLLPGPRVLIAPPNALGKWIAAAPGFIDMSFNERKVFHVESDESSDCLLDLDFHIQSALQFRRCGPLLAKRLGIPVEDPLFRAVWIESMSGPPYEHGVSSGASCVTAIMKDGHMVVANAGDCRAVLSWAGQVEALTRDHRAGREDERIRIKKLGGYVDNLTGTWRVQSVLAVSRGIGDIHLQEWISAEPEVQKLRIIKRDGLWNAVHLIR